MLLIYRSTTTIPAKIRYRSNIRSRGNGCNCFHYEFESYWFRIAAIGAVGQSGWSEHATKTVP